MMETMRQPKPLKAALPPRAKLHKLPTGAGGDPGRYKGDQDPTDDAEGLEYAKNYTTLHLKTKKVNDSEDTAVKGDTPSTGTASENGQGLTFTCNMSAAYEPLYGDPGEEDFWKSY
jgi:hypothetical protein